MSRTCPALIVIDPQNDYFPGGQFPLWNAEGCLARIEQAIARAQAQGIPVILVQHVADPARGLAPFFNADTPGAAIHPRIHKAAPLAPVIVKRQADSLRETSLEPTLRQLGVNQLLLCGMMTQNCVTHTALSPHAEGYQVKVLADCCTTVSQLLHEIALHALAPRGLLSTSEAMFGQA